MRKEKRNLAITEIFMILIAVIWFIPIYYLIVTTLKSSQEATANPLGLPKVLRLDNYVNAWVNMEFPRAFGNTLFITATAVLLIVSSEWRKQGRYRRACFLRPGHTGSAGFYSPAA